MRWIVLPLALAIAPAQQASAADLSYVLVTSHGIAFNVTVTALDASNATVTGYTGTVTFSSSSSGTLPGDYTFQAGDSGTKTFSVTLTTDGAQTITATDTVTSSITGTANTTVNACPVPTTPTITGTTNGTGTQDQACPEQPLTLTANTTGATSYQWYHDIDALSGETNQTYVATGSGTYYVTATNACGTTVQSAGYVVQNPTPHAAFVTSTGTTICAGGNVVLTSDSATGIQWYKDSVAIPGANSQSYTATSAGTYTAILDALGCHSSVSNSVVLTTSASTAPDATITAPLAVLAGSTGNVATVPDAGAGATYGWFASAGQITSGNGTNSITFKPVIASGTMSVNVTITLPGGCTTTGTKNVTVVSTAGPATHFSVTAPATVTAGTSFSVTVTALDASNLVANSYTGTVHFTSSSGGTLPADYTFTGGDAGTHSFNVTLTTTGSQSITATDTVTSSITGSTNTNVQQGVATHFAVTAPGSVTNGTSFSVSVTALDASNATVTGYTGTVHFTSSSSGTLPADYTFTGGDAGTHSFNVTLTTSGAQSITATDTVTSSITGTANTTVNCPSLSVTASNDGPSCGGSVNITATTANSGVTFSWTGPNGFTSNLQSTSVTESGTYTVTMTYNGCTATSSTNVSVNSTPSATITASSTACASQSYNASAPAGAATYNWSITNGSITSGNGTNAITFTVGATGTTTLNLSVSNGSCNASSSKSITIAPPPSANIPSTLSICGPGTITIPVTLHGTAPFTITWSDGFVQNSATKSTTRNVNITSNKTLFITSVSDASCTSNTDSKHISLEIDGAITVSQPPQNQYVANGAQASFFVVADGGTLHYHWYAGDVGDTSAEVGLDQPTFTTPWGIHGIDKFWLRITNACGSWDSAQFIATNSHTRRRPTGH